MDFGALVEAILSGRIVTSRHSLSEAANDDLKLGEIYDSVVAGGEVIEDYPDAYRPDLNRWIDWRIRR